MPNMKDGLDIAYYLILAAILVLIIMNAKNFAVAVGAVDSAANKTLGTISGSGYKLAS
jgi:hypothetical protein